MSKYVLDFGPYASGTAQFTVFRDLNTGQNLTPPALSSVMSGIVEFSWSSGIVVHFRATMGEYFVPGVIDQTDGVPFTGEGTTPVDHNYGGTDALRILNSFDSAPIGNASIYSYLAEDYDANRTARPTYLKGQSLTGADGRWTSSMWLDPGDYVLVVMAGGYTQKVHRFTVT